MGQMASLFHSTPSIYENIAELSDVERKTPMLEAVKKLVEERIKREDDMPIIWEPCLVKEVSDVTVSDVSCGLDHSLVLCGETSPPPPPVVIEFWRKLLN